MRASRRHRWVGVVCTVTALAVSVAWRLPAHTSVDVPSEVPIDSTASDADNVSRYRTNLALLRSATVRNTNHDQSPFRDMPSAELVMADHLGPRSEYLDAPGGNGETAWPVPAGGQFRVTCEFSHFSYDDPLVFPGQPGAAHLHMHFGNTDVNAFSTYDTLLNSGSSTCNGQELNRTGYWVPAMFDAAGNVRVPDRITVYYKGEGLTRGKAELYPPGAAMIASTDLNTVPASEGGVAPYKLTFQCTGSFREMPRTPAANTIPVCDGNRFTRTAIEHNVRFPTCWNRQDPTNPANVRTPSTGDWYGSNCAAAGDAHLPNMEYIISYHVQPGETTAGWFLSSDIDAQTGTLTGAAGSTSHGDWWGGWHRETNQQWLDNCTNYVNPSGVASGCGNGYLSDGGPNRLQPLAGPALKMRPQYGGPILVSASQLHRELCPNSSRPATTAADAAYCAPGGKGLLSPAETAGDITVTDVDNMAQESGGDATDGHVQDKRDLLGEDSLVVVSRLVSELRDLGWRVNVTVSADNTPPPTDVDD